MRIRKYLLFVGIVLVALSGASAQSKRKLTMQIDTVRVQGRVGLAITINDMPGQKFVLEIPEIFMVQSIRSGLYNYSNQVWNISNEGAKMVLSDNKYTHTIDLKVKSTKKSIGLKWKIAFTNNSDSTLYDLAAFNCWTMNEAPLFKDVSMERSTVKDSQGNEIFLKTVQRTQGDGRRNMQFYPAAGGINLTQSPWLNQWNVTSPQTLSGKKVSIRSTDGKWMFENCVKDDVAFFFNNWEGDHGCVHASPIIARELKPGNTAKASGSFKFTRL
jgi:hypothetical protein